MRILFAADFYAPVIGGLERQVQTLAEQFSDRHHDVAVATVWQQDLPRREQRGRIAIARLRAASTSVGAFYTEPSRRRYHPPFPDPVLAAALRRQIRMFRPDIVHAHGWIAFSCAAALVGLSTPLIVTAHDHGLTCAIRTLVHKGQVCDGPGAVKCVACAGRSYGTAKAVASVLGLRAAASLVRRKTFAIHAVSDFVAAILRRDLAGMGETRSPVIVTIPNIVDPPSGTNDLVPDLPDEPYILFVGALRPHKGIHVLLDAYARLSTRPPLVLSGTASWDSPKNFPTGARVYHDVPNALVMNAWQRSMFGVVPSVGPEACPLVVIEAMSCGRALIATRVGGIPELVRDGENGYLVAPGNATELAAALSRLITDDASRERMGRAAAERSREYRADALVPRFESLYAEAVASKND